MSLENINNAISLEPNNILFYDNRSYLWRKMENYKKAIEDYDTILILSPGNVKSLINKALDNYLEHKRKVFVRFYFLSNEDLLDILANCQDSVKIGGHIWKMFGGVGGFYYKREE